MSVNGVGAGGHIHPGLQPAREGLAREPLAPVDSQTTPPPSIGIAAMAPPGTDPELWAMLTSEEREFFDKAHAIGPITYGPRAVAPDPALPRGARIDMKV